ncbi:dipeptidase, partial [Planctomycetota bacterium]
KCILVAILVFCSLLVGSSSLYAKNESILARAARIHAEVLTIDTHVDTPLRFLRSNFDLGERHDPRKSSSKVDLPRMKEGGLDAVFFAVYVGQGPRTPEGNSKAKERALRTFDAIYETIQAHSNIAELALIPDDAYRIEKKGKRAIYIGMENGYSIGNDISLIRQYYDLGARYITLCHTRNNDICDSSTDKPEHHGLSTFGEKVVAEMNRLGMLIDVSHISDKAFYDVLEISKAPVLASHSCARALCDHPRNLNDEMLKKLAEKKGVIQMCVLSSYVKKSAQNPEREAALKAFRQKDKNLRELSDRERRNAQRERRILDKKYPRRLATVSDAVDHIDHIVRVAGIDHVGIGTDFDGGASLDGCYDVSELGNITLELVRRGYTEQQIRKIWGGNFMRVFRKAIELAESRQSIP